MEQVINMNITYYQSTTVFFCLAPLAWKMHVVAYVYRAYAIIENLSSCHSHISVILSILKYNSSFCASSYIQYISRKIKLKQFKIKTKGVFFKKKG